MANSRRQYRTNNSKTFGRHMAHQEIADSLLRNIGLPYSNVTHTARCKLCGDLASSNGLCSYCAKAAED